MAGGGFVAAGGHKIKGGRWTVFRFFLVSVAFTSAWVAVSSQLGYYRRLHGPAVLLQLNIAYFLPSIPLLVVSAFLDKPLEARLGVAKTILVRLLVGLVGYGAVCVWFPFMPEHIWYLLGAVVAFGLFGGIAFSASYQLVARFANKNVIALGLGCSASGPLVLLLQLALEMGPAPTRRQQVLLYEIIALVIAAGLWATVSLLWRHWDSIEQHAGKQDLTEPLLSEGQHREQTPGGMSPGAAADLEDGEQFYTPAASPLRDSPRTPRTASQQPLSPTSPGGAPGTPTAGSQLTQLAASVWRQRSLPPLAAYPSLEPHQTFLSTDMEIGTDFAATTLSDSDLLTRSRTASEVTAAARGRALEREGGGPRQLSAPPTASGGGSPAQEAAAEAGRAAGTGPGLSKVSTLAIAVVASPSPPPLLPAAAEHRAAARGGSASWQALLLMWAPLAALTLSSTVALILFPLFTYVPTSGLLGESLPKVIFFARIFADVLGRFLPRLRLLHARSPYTPLAAAAVKVAGVPLFLLYLKSPDRLHTDVGMVVFVAAVWVLGGYINTMANVLAPKLVPPQLKSAAAGNMAIAYQLAHFLGLGIATLVALLMYGSIAPHE